MDTKPILMHFRPSWPLVPSSYRLGSKELLSGTSQQVFLPPTQGNSQLSPRPIRWCQGLKFTQYFLSPINIKSRVCEGFMPPPCSKFFSPWTDVLGLISTASYSIVAQDQVQESHLVADNWIIPLILALPSLYHFPCPSSWFLGLHVLTK